MQLLTFIKSLTLFKTSLPQSLLLMMALVIATACDRDPMVRVYDVELRKSNPTTTSKAPATSEAKRMLGAILPAGEISVFLKLTGKPEVVETYVPAMKSIAESVKVGGDGQVEVTLPDGWTKAPSPPGKMSQFVIKPPSAEGVDEPMTVTVLPGMTDTAAWKGYVEQNLDRWQGQLGLQPAALDELLKDSVQPITYAQSELPAYLVNFLGKSSGKPSMAPFAGAGAMSPAQTPAHSESAAPSVPKNPAAKSIADTLKYELPEGWVSAEGSQMRIATFRTGTDENAAETSLVLASGEEKQIVQLWAESIYADKTSEDIVKSIIDQATAITTKSGQSGKVYKIIPPADAAVEKAMIVAVFHTQDSGPQQLFVKMIGPSKSVVDNEQKFDSFAQSLSW